MDVNDRGNAGGGNGKRRRRRRRRRGRGGNGGMRRQQQQDARDCRVKPSATPLGPEELNPFNLFCAYHLGVTPDNQYKFQSVNEVARRFSVDADTIRQKLDLYGLSSKELATIGFETEYAQLDMKVAPEGVSRRELGRSMWEDIRAQKGADDPLFAAEAAIVVEKAEAAEAALKAKEEAALKAEEEAAQPEVELEAQSEEEAVEPELDAAVDEVCDDVSDEVAEIEAESQDEVAEIEAESQDEVEATEAA